MIERKIGEVFEYKHEKFIIVELEGKCSECVAKTRINLCHEVGKCRDWLRKDCKSVVCKPYAEGNKPSRRKNPQCLIP